MGAGGAVGWDERCTRCTYKLLTQELGPRRFDLCSWFVRQPSTAPPAPQSQAASNCLGAGWSAPSACSDTAPRQHGMICHLWDWNPSPNLVKRAHWQLTYYWRQRCPPHALPLQSSDPYPLACRPDAVQAILRNTTSALTRRGLAGELTSVHGIYIRNTSLLRNGRVSVQLRSSPTRLRLPVADLYGFLSSLFVSVCVWVCVCVFVNAAEWRLL